MAINNIPFKNIRSVTFNCVDFTSPIKRGSRLRHAIYARKSVGLTPTPCGLATGQGMETLSFPFIMPWNHVANTIRDFENDTISWATCIPLTNHTTLDRSSTMLYFARTSLDLPVTRRFMMEAGMMATLVTAPNVTNITHIAYDSNSDDNRLFIGSATHGISFSDNVLNTATQILPGIVPTAMICAFGRLFVAVGTRLLFSAAMDMTDFTGDTSGELKIGNGMGSVIEFHVLESNRLLIVQEHGFSFLDVTHDEAGFKLDVYARSFKRIVRRTVQVFGDEVYFMSHGGMCRIMPNRRIELLDVPVKYEADHDERGRYSSVVFDNKYYITLSDKIMIIEKFFEGYSFIGDVRAWNLLHIFSLDGRHNALGVFEDRTGNINRMLMLSQYSNFNSVAQSPFGTAFTGNLPKFWESDPFGLSYAANRQFLKQFLIKTNVELRVTLTATSNGRRQTILVQPNDQLQKINVNLRGDMFTVRFETDASENIEISSLSCVVAFGNSTV